MTAETSTTISSISGGNLNLISGVTPKSNSVSQLGGAGNQNAKRGFQLETDKIENLQLSEQQTTNANPSALNKVSYRIVSPCRYQAFRGDGRRGSSREKRH
jgi:hypothetical protein